MNRVTALCGVVCVCVPVALLLFLASPGGDGSLAELFRAIDSALRAVHRELAETLAAVKRDGVRAATWLIALSFVYGVLHAAGPGHGKVVITTYLVTHRSRLDRGILLSVAASLVQGASAVIAVGVGVAVLGQSLRHTQSTADDLELLSYALVALVGLTLAIGGARRLLGRRIRRGEGSSPEATGHVHAHQEAHPAQRTVPAAGSSCCGHVHGPSAAQLATPPSWRTLVGMILAVGIRPCSGAVIVLLVAHSLEQHAAGVAAVLAMSLGTALAVSVLAGLAVYFRDFAIALSQRLTGSSDRMGVALEVVALSGGLVILIVGSSMFQLAWHAPVHPLR